MHDGITRTYSVEISVALGHGKPLIGRGMVEALAPVVVEATRPIAEVTAKAEA